MSLTSDQEWTLIACGLLALADRVLTGGEASRLLTLVSAYLEPEEQDEWMDLLSDQAALEAHFSRMSPPPEESHQALLERVWMIALADGEASMAEIRVFDQIGARLGISAEQLAILRKKWTYQAMETAEIAATFLALLLHKEAPPSDAEAERYAVVLGRLPLGKVRRDRLRDQLPQAPALEALTEQLHRLPRSRQVEALRAIADKLKDFPRRPLARGLLAEVALPAGIPQDVLDELPLPAGA